VVKQIINRNTGRGKYSTNKQKILFNIKGIVPSYSTRNDNNTAAFMDIISKTTSPIFLLITATLTPTFNLLSVYAIYYQAETA